MARPYKITIRITITRDVYDGEVQRADATLSTELAYALSSHITGTLGDITIESREPIERRRNAGGDRRKAGQ